MNAVCPHCHKRLALKGGKPGPRTVRCPRCGQSFPVTVPAAPTAAIPSNAGPQEPVAPVPRRLGGYDLIRPLGQGGMGTVYLARQVSLDRPVALKVMHRHLAGDPDLVARFLREAVAAARLVHPNVVQVYDVGEQDGAPFYSMEYVEGTSLAQLVHRDGPLPPETAASHVLQAARGLKYAHEHGLVHRDVKPDNLLLDVHGVVKVADLGLVKLPATAPSATPPPGGEGLTVAGAPAGTPAYMAPEQARGASSVDQRADIYSLGCTFYALLTGRAPFTGGSALEVMSRHCFEPIDPPQAHAPGLPPELSAIVLRMLAKKPEDRYPDCAALIRDLEQFLGMHKSGTWVPAPEQIARLEELARQFHGPATVRCGRARLAFYGACTSLALVCLLAGGVRWALALLFLIAATALWSFAIRGIVFRTPLYVRLRELLLELSWADRLFWSGAVLVAVIALTLAGLGTKLLALFALAGGWAVAHFVFFDKKAAAERAAPLGGVEQLLESLRRRGVDEDELYRFVVRHGGEGWEELFEALFGYDLLLKARQQVDATPGRRRPRHAPWRDPLIRAVEAVRRSRREARARALLAVTGQRALEQQGVVSSEARDRAEQAADAVVAPRPDAIVAAPPLALPAAQPELPPLTWTSLPMPTGAKPRRAWRRPNRLVITLRLFFGPRPRFLVGVVLLAACALWARQNAILPAWLLEEPRPADAEPVPPQPLRLPLVPQAWLGPFDSFNPGIAGLVLVLSAIWPGWRVPLFAIPAAAVMVLGPLLGMPSLAVAGLGEMPAQRVSLYAGLLLAGLGVLVNYIAEGAEE